MSFTARMIELAQSERARGTARRRLLLETEGAAASGESAAVTVHNVSTTGLLIECALPLMVDEAIEIDLPQAGPTTARVVWESERFFGCQFAIPISAAVLSAAALRSAPIGESEAARLPARETFGMRLHRLRREQHLTLAQVAAKLGVSKPTVWAWEQGKARPVEGRIEALSRALAVPVSELIPGTGNPALSEILARARGGIAAQLGTSPDKVKIMIEL